MSFCIISCVFFAVFYFYCPCRKTDDDDDDDDKYGVRSTSTRDSICSDSVTQTLVASLST